MSATRDPQVSASSQGDKAALLHRGLGVGSIVFMVVAAVAPLGAACAVIPLVFALGGNASAPLYFVAAAIVLYVFAVGFTLMSRHVKNAGAFYSYVQAGLGKIPGAGTASLALASYVILLIALYALLGVAAAAALDQYLGLSVSWWVCSFSFLVIISLLGYRDIEVSAKVLGVALVLEALVVLIVDFAVFVKGGDNGLSAAPLNPSHLFDGAPGLGLMFAFFAFVGFEATAVFRSEAKDPERTIPRATYIAVAIIGGLYALTSFAVANGLGVARAAAVAGADPSTVMQGSRVDTPARSSRTRSSFSWSAACSPAASRSTTWSPATSSTSPMVGCCLPTSARFTRGIGAVALLGRRHRRLGRSARSADGCRPRPDHRDLHLALRCRHVGDPAADAPDQHRRGRIPPAWGRSGPGVELRHRAGPVVRGSRLRRLPRAGQPRPLGRWSSRR